MNKKINSANTLRNLFDDDSDTEPTPALVPNKKTNKKRGGKPTVMATTVSNSEVRGEKRSPSPPDNGQSSKKKKTGNGDGQVVEVFRHYQTTEEETTQPDLTFQTRIGFALKGNTI